MKEIGTRATSERIDIPTDTLYTWSSKEKKRQTRVGEIVTEKGPEGLVAENEKLRKELREKSEEIEILQDALVFFVKRRKK
jgi:transposase